MRSAVIEAETREEVMREMEERMRSLERMYARRLMNEVRFTTPYCRVSYSLLLRRWSKMSSKQMLKWICYIAHDWVLHESARVLQGALRKRKRK